MSGSVNKVILIGNCVRDPEIRNIQAGGKVANITVATSERWRDKTSGEQKEKSEFHRISVFNDRIVDVVEKFVKKGSKLYIEGSLQTRKWTDQSGVEKYTTEINIGKFNGQITLLDSKKEVGQTSERAPARPTSTVQWDANRPTIDLDDSIPY